MTVDYSDNRFVPCRVAPGLSLCSIMIPFESLRGVFCYFQSKIAPRKLALEHLR